VAVIDPDRLPASPKPPPVVIESCLIDRQTASLNQPLFLKPGYENLEIQYTALSLIHSEHIRFRYKLGGLDRDWVDAGTRRTAYYSHLPPGSYTFQVAAAHSDGVWSPAVASLALTVLPPFYRTWWFQLLAAAALAGSVHLGWHYRIRQLERGREAQQAFAGQLIASQEAERKRIAAELHDSLGQRLVIIKNRALLLLRERAGAAPLSPSQSEQIEEISSEASEAGREVREISYNLRPYRLDRLGLTAALRAMIEAASTSSSTNFTAAIEEIDGLLGSHDAINFYRIVQECVNNILKHAQAAEATVQIRRTPGRLRLTVRDDGCGFTPGPAKGALFEGFGLNGISERAHLLGGKLSLQSGPGQGTMITIDLERPD
jgi:signal transduction histidine kinase